MSKANQVVIVGRMNVGKSTLFNRLAENVRSIAIDYEGVTRDFLKDRISWRNSEFDLIDTGGIELKKTDNEILKKVTQIVLNLIDKSDLVLFLVDGKAGLMPGDREIANFLHSSKKTVIVAVNKIDTKEAKENLFDFYNLGFDKVVGISSEHSIAINEVLDLIVENLPKQTAPELVESEFKVIFLGRPNAGKSSLLNALLQQERSIVSAQPGTTREAISEKILFYKHAIELTDTPGIRRKRSVSGELEPLMVKSAFAALKHSDIVVLIIDGSDSNLVDQELKLAFYAFADHYKCLILVINKSDIETEENRANLEMNLDVYQHLIKKIPVMHISCKTGKNVGKLLPLIKEVYTRYTQKFDDVKLYDLFITNLNKTPLFHTAKLLVLYKVKQIKSGPIIIELVVNHPKWFGPSQLSFFENLMRSEYDMVGAPIKFVLRKR